MLVYEKLVDTPSINAERMTSVYPSNQWLRSNAQDPLLVFTAYVVLSMGLSRKFTFEFLMINRIDIKGMVIDKFLMRLL